MTHARTWNTGGREAKPFLIALACPHLQPTQGETSIAAICSLGPNSSGRDINITILRRFKCGTLQCCIVYMQQEYIRNVGEAMLTYFSSKPCLIEYRPLAIVWEPQYTKDRRTNFGNMLRYYHALGSWLEGSMMNAGNPPNYWVTPHYIPNYWVTPSLHT